MDKQEFIKKIAGYVQKYAPAYGILVHSPIIAKAILESGWGESRLAAVYHNYFGLKCGTKWTGKSVNLSTMEEYTPGTLTQIKDNFRVYDNMEEGVKGYFEFIQLPRYQNLRGITDPETYLKTIKADGYATSSKYVDNTMRIVTQYDLQQYDVKGAGSMAKLASAVLAQARAWIGRNEADGTHKGIIDVYNGHKPLARGYKVKYTDAWCATFVSAVAIKCGLTDIIPTECGCGQMIALFKNLGEWQESDSRTPSPGDIIFYDWDDTGAGDCTGWPDHVGIVESVSGGKAYLLIMIADRNAVRFCIVLQSFQNKHAYVSSIIRCVPLVRQRHARVVGHKIIARVFRKMSAVQRVKPACRPVHDRAYPRMVNRLWSVRTQERALHDLCFAAHAP